MALTVLAPTLTPAVVGAEALADGSVTRVAEGVLLILAPAGPTLGFWLTGWVMVFVLDIGPGPVPTGAVPLALVPPVEVALLPAAGAWAPALPPPGAEVLVEPAGVVAPALPEVETEPLVPPGTWAEAAGATASASNRTAPTGVI